MYRRLNRIWRIVATAASFSLFGLGGLGFTLLALPALRLFVRNAGKRRRATRTLICRSFAAFIGFMRLAGLLDCEVSGLEHLRAPGVVIVANHPSLIDVLFLVAYAPEASCVVKSRLWHHPVTGPAVRQAGYVSNAEGPELIQRCRQALGVGNRLVVFPEGTRSRPGQPVRFQRGAANIALHAGADIVPVIINVRPTTLIKGARWYHVPASKVHLSMRVQPAIATRAYIAEYGNIPKAARRLTADLEGYYRAGPEGAAGHRMENTEASKQVRHRGDKNA